MPSGKWILSPILTMMGHEENILPCLVLLHNSYGSISYSDGKVLILRNGGMGEIFLASETSIKSSLWPCFAFELTIIILSNKIGWNIKLLVFARCFLSLLPWYLHILQLSSSMRSPPGLPMFIVNFFLRSHRTTVKSSHFFITMGLDISLFLCINCAFPTQLYCFGKRWLEKTNCCLTEAPGSEPSTWPDREHSFILSAVAAAAKSRDDIPNWGQIFPFFFQKLIYKGIP